MLLIQSAVIIFGTLTNYFEGVFVTFSTFFLPKRLFVASAICSNTLFEAVLNAYITDFLSIDTAQTFAHVFLQRMKIHSF